MPSTKYKRLDMRIGILGGTFNPLHNGHLHVAKEARKKLHLDKLIFIPAYMPPHKKIHGNAKPSDRLRMLELATGGKKHFAISRYEMRRKGRSYSIKTAKYLKKKYGKDSKIFFIIGADSLKGLTRWKDITKLSGILRFAVAPRRGFKMSPRIRVSCLKLSMSKKDVSSTTIRRLLSKGKPVTRLLPPKVAKYIKMRNLYST